MTEMKISDRLVKPISNAELERRWAAVRKLMEDEGIDVLLMQANQDGVGGYVKYFTDIQASNGYPLTVVFPRDDRMTTVSMGPFGQVQDLPEEGNGFHRGVKQTLHTPHFSSAYYTNDDHGLLAAQALKPYQGATIGLVATGQMSHALIDCLRRNGFSNSKFVDATDMVDRVKCIKSPEEMEFIKGTLKMHDEVLATGMKAIKPGARDIDVRAAMMEHATRLGSTAGIYSVGSSPMGQPTKFFPAHAQGRTIQEGDVVAILLENSGAGGFYGEIGRSAVVGKVPDDMKEEFQFALSARKVTLDMLKPGTSCKDIWDTYNAYMRDNGRPEEARLYCHGQGYDLVERPLVRFDEPAPIQKDTFIVVHPSYTHRGYFNWVCDNYFIGENGVGERLHTFPEEVVELG